MNSLGAILLAVFVVAASPARAEWTYTTIAGADGVPLNMISRGDPGNPAILFIHGIGQSHYSFVHQFNSDLADDYYLVAYDLRGHGESGKPSAQTAYRDYRAWARDVDAVLAASGARRPVVVAWSYGTIVLMDYVREYGTSRLGGVIMTGALGGIMPVRMPSPDDPGMAAYAELRRLQMSPDLADRLEAADAIVDLLTAKPAEEPYRTLFMSIGFMLPRYARQAMLSRSIDNQDLLAELQLPVLLSLGSGDNAAMLEDGAQLAQQRDNFSLSLYDGAGHSVFFEMPERFNAELREFAEAHQVASPGGL